MLGLRLNEGISLPLFARRYGIAFDTLFGTRLAPLEAAGLLERVDGRIRLSERGRLLGNEVFERLLPDE
jgi:oxygen-independent coproporphyrinogen-3 oxidase